jgi:hypothetical protein
LSLNYSCGSGAIFIAQCTVTHFFVFKLQFVAAAQSAWRSYIESLIICLYHITVCGSAPVTLNVSLFLSLNYSLRQRHSLHCAVTLNHTSHIICLDNAVCGSGAVCIAQFHQITHYLSLNNSLRQRRSLYRPVTSNYSLFVFQLQFALAAQSALRSYIESLIICL